MSENLFQMKFLFLFLAWSSPGCPGAEPKNFGLLG
ncbi:hypothetical protein CsSME_00034800 [Camellia sinensis var. sinensis]